MSRYFDSLATYDSLIAWINSHEGVTATAMTDQARIRVTCPYTYRDGNNQIQSDIETLYIPATLTDAREWLGY